MIEMKKAPGAAALARARCSRRERAHAKKEKAPSFRPPFPHASPNFTYQADLPFSQAVPAAVLWAGDERKWR